MLIPTFISCKSSNCRCVGQQVWRESLQLCKLRSKFLNVVPRCWRWRSHLFTMGWYLVSNWEDSHSHTGEGIIGFKAVRKAFLRLCGTFLRKGLSFSDGGFILTQNKQICFHSFFEISIAIKIFPRFLSANQWNGLIVIKYVVNLCCWQACW